MNYSIDECVEMLDSCYGDWDMWRVRPSTDQPLQWLVRIHVEGNRQDPETFQSESLPVALQLAADFKPLPRIPQKPYVYRRCDFEVAKQRGQWVLKHCGQQGYFRDFQTTPTKKAANALADRLVENSENALALWVDRYGSGVEEGVEGVDFRWKA